MQSIIPYLWFDADGQDAAEYYTTIFPDSELMKIVPYGPEGPGEEGSAMTVEFAIQGNTFLALNGGPMFTKNPSISFFILCESDKEVDILWEALSKDGEILMELGKYPWSNRYGWCQDQFGLSWQIMAGEHRAITPALLFAGKHWGHAEEAMHIYTSLFPNSKIETIHPYEPGDPGPEGKVNYAEFTLNGQTFIAMDSGMEMPVDFNEAVSFMIMCESQEEIDTYWSALTADGGEESMCGWLKDKFGVSWQVVPAQLASMMNDTDREKAGRVVRALMPMKKIDLPALQNAYDGA